MIFLALARHLVQNANYLPPHFFSGVLLALFVPFRWCFHNKHTHTMYYFSPSDKKLVDMAIHSMFLERQSNGGRVRHGFVQEVVDSLHAKGIDITKHVLYGRLRGYIAKHGGNLQKPLHHGCCHDHYENGIPTVIDVDDSQSISDSVVSDLTPVNFARNTIQHYFFKTTTTYTSPKKYLRSKQTPKRTTQTPISSVTWEPFVVISDGSGSSGQSEGTTTPKKFLSKRKCVFQEDSSDWDDPDALNSCPSVTSRS